MLKANSVTKLLGAMQQYPPGDVASLEAQIADLKQLVALVQSQLADIRDQKDNVSKCPTTKSGRS